MSWNEETSFLIREYRHEDFRDLCAIDRLCFPEAIAYTPEEIALALAQPGAFALLAEMGKQVVGFVLAYQKKRHLGHVVTIDVLPEFRRLGLGQKLMERAEQRLRINGATRVVLEVNIKNEHALRFYLRLGYITRRLLPNYYPDGSDAHLMEKALV